MKLSKKAQNLISLTNYTPATHPAICALVAFAAQNSGIEYRNYASDGFDKEGRKAYFRETRAITKDWNRFKMALILAHAHCVLEKDVIAEAPHAFSGRLEPKATHRFWGSAVQKVFSSNESGYVIGTDENHSQQDRSLVHIAWDYTPGQYFPTEYRKAASVLLEQATNTVRRNRGDFIKAA